MGEVDLKRQWERSREAEGSRDETSWQSREGVKAHAHGFCIQVQPLWKSHSLPFRTINQPQFLSISCLSYFEWFYVTLSQPQHCPLKPTLFSPPNSCSQPLLFRRSLWVVTGHSGWLLQQVNCLHFIAKLHWLRLLALEADRLGITLNPFLTGCIIWNTLSEPRFINVLKGKQ